MLFSLNATFTSKQTHILFYCRYFMMMRDGHIPSQQDGVFRSNCMDCLDRTNVVQGLFAKVTLEEQLEVSWYYCWHG